ncbi:MAG: 1-acyl-sn-glycerol-3-phosphate acyltransferase [Clostridia bacterium]|nr:1-acyl-sn-glycerol-3-phosphate acyltransferase [Clostridia bacterium]
MAKSKFTSIFNIKYLPMDYGRAHYFIYRLLKVRTLGLDGKKYRRGFSGGAVIAANHTGFSDAVTLGGSFWYRRVFFLASEEVMAKGFLSFMLKLMGCIKVDRNISDIEAIRSAVSVIKNGHTLAVFPQGRIEKTEEVADIKSGAVLIALQSGAPIIPVYSRPPASKFSRRTVVVGEPICCSDYCKKKFPSVTDINNISSILLEKINECRDAYEKGEKK